MDTQHVSKVLAVDVAGRPLEWLGLQQAVRYYVLDQVLWTVGDVAVVIRGGMNDRGVQSLLTIHPVIALRGALAEQRHTYVPALTNTGLFARDRHRCMYCGEQFPRGLLTRDHIMPRSRGGQNIWGNCTSAYRGCNTLKDNRTPEEAGMKLLALPYTPNLAEALILQNRRILADQMEFLEAHRPRRRRANG